MKLARISTLVAAAALIALPAFAADTNTTAAASKPAVTSVKPAKKGACAKHKCQKIAKKITAKAKQ